MSDSFTAAVGRKVVSRTSAAEVGSLSRLVVDVATRQVTALVVDKGRKARLVEWTALSGFGPDAVMVADDAAVRQPADESEKAAVGGTFELIGKRVLTDLGTELGTVDDVLFDPQTGSLEKLLVGGHQYPASTLLGNGSYAAVLDSTTHPI
jgi:sporulation protein YlmC with PRC-barrel domain